MGRRREKRSRSLDRKEDYTIYQPEGSYLDRPLGDPRFYSQNSLYQGHPNGHSYARGQYQFPQQHPVAHPAYSPSSDYHVTFSGDGFAVYPAADDNNRFTETRHNNKHVLPRNQYLPGEIRSNKYAYDNHGNSIEKYELYPQNRMVYQNGELQNTESDLNRNRGKRSHDMPAGEAYIPNGNTVTDGKTDSPGNSGTTVNKATKRPNILKRISNGIVQGLERMFYNLGLLVGTHPKKTIAICVIVPLLLGIGLIKFKDDKDFAGLLIPPTSRIHTDQEWIEEHEPYEVRGVSVIVENDNVLTKKTLLAMLTIYKDSLDLRTNGIGYTDICTGINGQCIVNSLLDLWRYNETVINNLTDQDIVDTVSQTTINPTYLNEFKVERFIGSITRDSNGRITGARAAMMLWAISSNTTNEDDVRDFEKLMVVLGKKGHPDVQHVYILYKDSFDDEFFEAVYGDIFLLIYGFPFVLIYMNLAFGRPNMVEHKFLLVGAALTGVLLSAAVCYGVCLAAGLKFGATHQALGFLLLAVGVDDSFVVMESWKRVDRKHPDEPNNVKMALTMKHAGVSVTVTSISDIAAFAVGISTIMPILSSFCVYSAVGIFALYILQSTFFPACLIIDQERIAARRNGFAPCYVHKNWSPNRYSDIEFVEPFFKKIFGPIILSIVGKVVVILITLGLAGVMTWSLSTIDKGFQIEKGLSEDSYARQFITVNKEYFPSTGYPLFVYCDKMDYETNFAKYELMVNKYAETDSLLNGTLQSWIQPFKTWLQIQVSNGAQMTLNADGVPDNSTVFNAMLYQFIYREPEGIAFKGFVHMSENGSEILFTRILGEMAYLEGHGKYAENEKNMVAVRKIADESGTDATCFAYCEAAFLFTEVVQYVDDELLRNFILAGVCVFIVTLFLIVDPRTSFFVLICVVLTTICLGGTFRFMEYTIDGNMVILLTFSVGLAVDFSAHVGYMFMTVRGTKNERAQKTLCNIGPAVWHGAFSTFLGFVALAFAKSFSLQLFFYTFGLVVGFGLFFGLCFLPVILSLIGPPPYDDAELDDAGVVPDWQTEVDKAYSVEEEVDIRKQGFPNGDLPNGKYALPETTNLPNGNAGLSNGQGKVYIS